MHTPNMRLIQFFITLLIATCSTWATAQATFPAKPIRVVIGFPAGGPLDQHARLLSERLQQVLGQPIIIDYKSGEAALWAHRT